MQTIFEIVVKQISEFFRIRHMAIFQLNPSLTELILLSSSGFDKSSIQSLSKVKAENGAFKRLVDTRIPQIVNDVSETEISPLAELAKTEKLESMIAVPVFSGQKFYGILSAFSQEKSRFKEEDARIISLFGGQLGQLMELFSQHLRDNIDELLVQILGSIGLLNFRYSNRDKIPVSEILSALERLKNRTLSFVAGLEQASAEAVAIGERSKREEITVPFRNQLNIEEVITIQGEKKKSPKLRKVLVIDDEPLVTDLLINVLERMDHKPVVASCGKDGVELFEKDEFDLVITDLGMPDLSGWQVSKAVKQKKPDVPVVVITGWGIDPDPSKMKDSKVDFVITKPFQIDQLEKIIKDMLEK